MLTLVDLVFAVDHLTRIAVNKAMMHSEVIRFAESTLWPVSWFYIFLLGWAMLHVVTGHHYVTQETLDRLRLKPHVGRSLEEVASENVFFGLIRRDITVSRWVVLLLCLQASMLYLTANLELSYNQAWVEALLLSMVFSPATRHFIWNFARTRLVSHFRHGKNDGEHAPLSEERAADHGASMGETMRVYPGTWFLNELTKTIIPGWQPRNRIQSENRQNSIDVGASGCAPGSVQPCALAPGSAPVHRKEIVHIDDAVLPLVEALNKCGCYRTYSSCKGHGKGRPFVLFQSEMSDAVLLEAALRTAWPEGRLHVEWAVKMIFDEFCRLRYELSPVVWTIDLPCKTPSRREVANDLLALSYLVSSLRTNASSGNQEKETHTDQNQQPTDQHSDFSHTQLPFLFANGPRTVGPAFRTGYRIIRYFFHAYRAKDYIRHIPYSLWTAIRVHNSITLAGWCQHLDAGDPLQLRDGLVNAEAIQCLGYQKCGGWPLFSGGGKPWFLFAGSEATFCRLVWLARSLDGQAGHWNMEGFFDLSMRPRRCGLERKAPLYG